MLVVVTHFRFFVNFSHYLRVRTLGPLLSNGRRLWQIAKVALEFSGTFHFGFVRFIFRPYT